MLSVLSWSDEPTPSATRSLVRRGVPDLIWSSEDGPTIVLNPEFGKGFRGYREGIRSAKALSNRMAEVAQDVRDEVRCAVRGRDRGRPDAFPVSTTSATSCSAT